MLGVMTPTEALKIARERSLDLVEISPTATPPVCKITDYGKFMYEKKKKEHDARKKQVIVSIKEVQLRPQTEEHDIEYKVNHIIRFLGEGDKAKVSIMFRGREITHIEDGRALMKQVIERVKEHGAPEVDPKLEGKRLSVIIAPLPNVAKTGKKAHSDS